MRKDASTVLPDRSFEGKQQHVVEVCNASGRRNLAAADRAQVHPDFHAETALEAVIQFAAVARSPETDVL